MDTARIAIATEALAALGKTEAEVAESLRERNIRQVHGDRTRSWSCTCPVAVYLHSVGVPEARVGRVRVYDERNLDDTICSVPLPVQEFIRTFDTVATAYPHLRWEFV